MNKSICSLIFILCSMIEVQVKAQEAIVIEVKKNVSLSKNDKVYRHYFINGGANQGLTKGSVVDVVRRVAVHDPLKNASIGDIRVKVAELEVIHSDPKISVAKMVGQESPENRPVLDIEAIMVGDRLDLSTVRMGAKLQQEADAKVAAIAAAKKAAALASRAKPGSRQIASVKKKAKTAKSVQR